MSSLELGQLVSVNGNELSWIIRAINGPIAVIESGQTGIRQRRLLTELRPWVPGGEGRVRG